MSKLKCFFKGFPWRNCQLKTSLPPSRVDVINSNSLGEHGVKGWPGWWLVTGAGGGRREMGLVSEEEVCSRSNAPHRAVAPRPAPRTDVTTPQHTQSIAVGFFGLSGNWSSRPKETTGNISSVCSFGAPHMDNVWFIHEDILANLLQFKFKWSLLVFLCVFKIKNLLNPFYECKPLWWCFDWR